MEKNVKNFEDFVNESYRESRDRKIYKDTNPGKIITPTLRKSLDSLGDFKTTEQIISAIEFAGFKRILGTRKWPSADYAFENPSEYNSKYVSYRTGDVKERPVTGTRNPTSVSRATMPDPMDRLRLILRRAVKCMDKNKPDLYDKWKKTGLSFSDFCKKYYGMIKGVKFGI